ncbi:hypothetical protein IC582_019943 [Cucumis melo]
MVYFKFAFIHRHKVLGQSIFKKEKKLRSRTELKRMTNKYMILRTYQNRVAL